MAWPPLSGNSTGSAGSSRKGRRRNRSNYRSSRSVRRTPPPSSLLDGWTRCKLCLLLGGVLVLCFLSLSPMLVLQQLENDLRGEVVGLSALLHRSKSLRYPSSVGDSEEEAHIKSNHKESKHLGPPVFERNDNDARKKKTIKKNEDDRHEKKKGGAPKQQQHDKNQYQPTQEELNLARGVAGLPFAQTPALIGAKRGHIQCDVDVDDLAYWNAPQGHRDDEFISYYKDPPNRFLTFEPDPGGWNNVRMSMEVIFVLAAATGRTLVLPPRAPMYLLGDGTANARSFANFFPINEKFKKKVNVITMEEFLVQQGERLLGLNESQMDTLRPVADICVHQPPEKDARSCDWLFPLLQEKGVQPVMEASNECLVFDNDVFEKGGNLTAEKQARADAFCGEKRDMVLYNHTLHNVPLIHWQASNLTFRLLNHFYAFTYFTDPVVDNYYKRFVRDLLHYKDELYCAAGKIVHALQKEGTFSTLHIRRGDFQFKEVKISAQEWYNNSKEIWKPKEILYIATDERNKTWFEPLAKYHELRFLDDYWDMAKLGELDSSFISMVDTIVASQGRTFVGTWFSTFSGYINRMRGYLGYSMTTSFYSYLPRKKIMHPFETPHGNYHAREFHSGWVGIDGDTAVDREGEVPILSGEPSVANRTLPKLALSDVKQDSGFVDKPVARGLAGRPTNETPALDGASRAHIECDVNVDSLAYWNDPQGTRDVNFKSPFAVEGEKYISFVPDSGGWNNVRMSMEIIFVIAAASGRTLVLPPEQPLYLLHHDKGKKQRGFADFFPLHTAEFQKRVPTITMEEFVKREGGKDGRLPIPEAIKDTVLNAASHCEKRKKSVRSCDALSEYLAEVGHSPTFRGKDGCVVFDKDAYHGKVVSAQSKLSASLFCGERNITYWNKDLADPVLVHFRGGEKEFRLLTHYYLMLHFTDPAIDHYYKRFVRDFLHYHDSIYCAAGKIVKALQAEGIQRGFAVNDEGNGGFSAMHIRRGDFQYKRVKIPAEQWYNNTRELWLPDEILYMATDERNKTWFDPIQEHHTLRFLDDYWDIAGLADADPNHFGMLDTIIASRARAFAGTWFSTFSGYINRMRGHHGMTMNDSWYSFLPKKTAVHEWKNYSGAAYAYESPIGWIGIDADVPPSKEKF